MGSAYMRGLLGDFLKDATRVLFGSRAQGSKWIVDQNVFRLMVPHQGHDSSLAAAVAMAPFDSGFDPRQRRHLIRAQLVSQLIRVQLVLLD
uniref:Uncharacterized protein n=1 Tax=Vitis vinifera TaxID=29760 RepID=A5BKP7_VITVI|nr:hypothetical protein VITISV_039362 [Vitis vinifera]